MSETAHHASIQVGIVLVLFLVDKVEIAAKLPRAEAVAADVANFLQERDLFSISLMAINQVIHHGVAASTVTLAVIALVIDYGNEPDLPR